jgi:hypothetical protein
MFQALKLIPAHVVFVEGELLGITLFGLAGLAWALLPFWAIKDGTGKARHVMTLIGVLAVVFFIGMTLFGYLA